MKKIGEIAKQQIEKEKSCNLPERQAWLDKRKDEIIALHGDAKEFALRFNPDIQVSCALNLERSLTGNAPTLRQLEYAYGVKGIRAWFSIQLENLNKFVGVANKMTVEQMQMLADIFIVKVPYLKASEILLFFYKFKSGDLGELYGSVDPLKLSTSLNEFLKWRSFELDKVYQRQREEKRRLDIEHRKINAITREEYEEKKAKANKQEASE